jgi:hypothetical protein
MTKKATAEQRMASAWHTPEIHEIHMAGAVLAIQSSSSAAIKRGYFPFVERKDDIGGQRPGPRKFKEPVLRTATRHIRAGDNPSSLRRFATEIANEAFDLEERPAVKTVERIIRKSKQWPQWRHLFRGRGRPKKRR